MILRRKVLPSSRNIYQIGRMFSSESPLDSGVVFNCVNNKGIITLNKPKVLNSINLEMVSKIYHQLQQWENSLEMVIIKGGDKAFCAGGDIVNVTKEGPKHAEKGKTFFRSEYVMNNLIGTYKIPYIALIHGITMGGGVGLSVHGQVRVATEKTLFAMPETAIGLFPDVGGTYALSRLPQKLGHFLALTGYRLKGIDVVKAGIATHYCESSKLQSLLDALIGMKGPVCNYEQDVLSKFCEDVSSHAFVLSSKMDKIENIFSFPTVEGILCELEKDGSEWAISVLKTLRKMSPFSLKLSKKALEYGQGKTLQECLQMENRLAGAVMDGRHSLDFYEGVRALLIDKDQNPKWSPSKLEDITEEMVENYFKPLPACEELTI